VKNFKQWLEDTGEVSPRTNDEPYAEKGVASKYVNNDKKTPPKSRKKTPESIFGFTSRDRIT